MMSLRQAGYGFVLFGVLFSAYLAWVTTYLFSVNSLLHNSCNLDPAVCPFVGFPIQSTLGFILDAGLFGTGIAMVYYSKQLTVRQRVSKKEQETQLKSLNDEEKKIYDIIVVSGAAFQSDIVEKSGINKVKVSRILDKLEGRGLVERRRRGMSNVIVPKQS